jgi:hypothetical protein|tara:strand:- start:196 stop:582 length:387 start_codon:yes stop_codon:yes gene_type:complete
VNSYQGTDVSNCKPYTKYLNINEILLVFDFDLPYYKEVLNDVLKNDYYWGVTKQVLKYANYLKSNPESVFKLPPIKIINNRLDDGAHRISAIYLLSQLLDKDNLYWNDVKLRVDFYTVAPKELDKLKK